MPGGDSDWNLRFEAWCLAGEQLGEQASGDPLELLSVLRQLEKLHRQLQEGPFRSSLPADRQKLFSLLQSMERSGGWPYIPRLQLKTFMELLETPVPAA